MKNFIQDHSTIILIGFGIVVVAAALLSSVYQHFQAMGFTL